MIIRKCVKVVAGPVVERATRITIEIPGEALEWKIRQATLAEGCDGVTVDWGDGTRERLASIANAAHTYAAAGRYEVTLSDEIAALAVVGNSPAAVKLAKRIVAFASNATKLTELGNYALWTSSNLVSFDVTRSAIRTLGNMAFKGCTGLVGRIDLPCVTEMAGTSENNVFTGCAGIAEIHFAAANEAAVRATSAFKADPQLGAENCVVMFDL